MKKLLIALCVMCLCASCKHEPEFEPCKLLVRKNFGHQGFDINSIYDTIWHSNGYFNPVNPNEIIFQSSGGADLPWFHSRLIKFNLQSRVLDTLLTAEFWGSPNACWNSEGWIIFGLDDSEIWKMKDNGEELTRITNNTSSYLNPLLTNNPNVFICDNNWNGLLMTLDGTIIDTLLQYPNQSGTTSCNGNNVLVGHSREGVLVKYKIGENTPEVIPDDKFDGKLMDLCWLTDSTFIWSDFNGIYITNANNYSKVQVLSTCETRLYSTPCYSKSINKVMWTKLYQDQVEGTYNVHTRARLVMMNPDGTDEEEIDIPR